MRRRHGAAPRAGPGRLRPPHDGHGPAHGRARLRPHFRRMKPPSSRIRRTRAEGTIRKTDSNLQVDVSDELACDPAISHTDIGVMVRDGVVTLTGTLPTMAEKHAVEDAVRRVAGVKG